MSEWRFPLSAVYHPGQRSRVLVPSFAGFDAVTLANNHFNDFGSEGVRLTVDILKKTGIKYFGDSYGKWDTSQVFLFAFLNTDSHYKRTLGLAKPPVFR